MSLSINTNVDALTAYRNLSKTQSSMSTSIERLSSGLRINKAADDAAGLAISQGLTAQINGISQAQKNAQDGINVVQTADGALNETQSILQRMRTLAVQSANDSNDDSSRADIQTEVTQLQSELDKIANQTTFNNVSLLDGSFAGKQFQVGYAANDTIGVTIQSQGAAARDTASGTFNPATAMEFKYGSASDPASAADVNVTTTQLSAAGLTTSSTTSDVATALNKISDFSKSFTASTDDAGNLVVAAKQYDGNKDDVVTISGGGLTAAAGTGNVATKGGFGSSGLGVDTVDLSTQAGAETALDTLDSAIQQVSTARAQLGALQNTFQHQINNLSVTQTNLQSSNSSIQDTDMAAEMTNYSSTQVLSQAGTAMLKQANSESQSILSLLQG